jgi:hypothetical protein
LTKSFTMERKAQFLKNCQKIKTQRILFFYAPNERFLSREHEKIPKEQNCDVF